MAVSTEREAIVATVRDYVDGWFDGDAGRMERALHPELVKRSYRAEDGGPRRLETLTAEAMIGYTAAGWGVQQDVPDRGIVITVEYEAEHIAAVTCLCHCYVDLLHLVRTPEGWRIVNVVWCPR